MILSVQSMLIIFLLSVPFFWYFTSYKPKLAILIGISCVAVYAYSAMAFLVITGCVLLTWLCGFAVARRKSTGILCAAAIISTGPLIALETYRIVTGENVSLLTAGLAFATLRQIAYLIDLRHGRIKPGFFNLFLLNLFYPTFLSGPIETVRSLPASSLAQPFSIREFSYGLSRMAVGCFKIYFLYSTLLPDLALQISPDRFEDWKPLAAYGSIMLKWVTLYIGFSGYADLAIGTARLYGIKIRENFNSPFLATSIQNYWQRWHISLMNYVFEYIFRPFVRKFGKPQAGLFLVFLVIGLWHKFTLAYLLWGVSHAIAMIIYRNWRLRTEDNAFLAKARKFFAYKIASALLTLSYVAFVSYIASADSFTEGLKFVGLAFGLR